MVDRRGYRLLSSAKLLQSHIAYETCIGESDEHVLTVTTLQVYRFYKMVAVGILPIWSQLKPNLVAKCTV